MTKDDIAQDNEGPNPIAPVAKTLVLTLIGLLTLFLAGVLAGYTAGVFENGAPVMRDYGILAALIGGIAVSAFGFWRLASTMWKDHAATDEQAPPGEANTRRRVRKEVYYITGAGLLGGVIGVIVAVSDQGDGNVFGGDWDKLSLDPTVAILLAVVLVFALTILPLWMFRLTDELVREQNLIAFTGGALAVLSGFPAWAVLHAGGWAPEPDPFGVWMIAFLSMFVAFGYAKWRARY